MFSALAFAVLMYTRVYPPELRSVNLDTDWFYRRLLPRGLGGVERAYRGVAGAIQEVVAAVLAWMDAWARILHGPRSPLARTWASGAMGLGVMLMLLGFLLSYYLA